jgi:hypothetical protein
MQIILILKIHIQKEIMHGKKKKLIIFPTILK